MERLLCLAVTGTDKDSKGGGQREAAPLSILGKSQIPKSLRSKSFQNTKIKVQNDRATVSKKLKCKKQRCKERHSIFEFWALVLGT